MVHIEDFGQKIGGARKDMWKLTGITDNDLAEMNDLERTTYVKKENIWIKPDWEQLIADGTPQAVAYWMCKMRQAVPPKPPMATEEAQKNYVTVVTKIRDAVMAAEDAYDVNRFYNDVLLPNFTNGRNTGWYFNVLHEAEGIVTNKLLRIAQTRYSKLEEEAKKNLFGVPKDQQAYVAAKQSTEIYRYDNDDVYLDCDRYNSANVCLTVRSTLGRTYYYLRPGDEFYNLDDWEQGTYFVMETKCNRKPLAINFKSREAAEAFVEEYACKAQNLASEKKTDKNQGKVDSNRKKHFLPPQLAHIKYTGPNYRGIRYANSERFLEDLKFRGGEFGNWLNNDDRQANLNMAYDALRNLAALLKVQPEDVSLNGSLAIAFGARGKGGASAGAAHYEPLRQVINLTKMSGAGCLAHEWGHALDHAIGIASGDQTFASEINRRNNKLPESFLNLISAMKYKEAVVSDEECRKKFEPKIKEAEGCIRGWINGAKPDKIPEDLSKAWDEILDRIIAKVDTFTGNEYWTGKGKSVSTIPDVEELSNICKFVSGHVIPKKNKEQVALWAKEIQDYKKSWNRMVSTKSVVKTQYYQDSIAFDDVYSKYGHGYWQSDCEMFARAFDCYIADKVKEAGYRSDYLSSNADSFVHKDGERVIAAFPRGEEREAINQAFDALFVDLKELGILHEEIIPEKVIEPEPEKKVYKESDELPPIPGKALRYEQLSLDEMLFAASSRAGTGGSEKANKGKEHSR